MERFGKRKIWIVIGVIFAILGGIFLEWDRRNYPLPEWIAKMPTPIRTVEAYTIEQQYWQMTQKIRDMADELWLIKRTA